MTIHEGDIFPVGFQSGTTVFFQRDDVKAYVRSRRTELTGEAIDCNNNYMARQKQYMMNSIQKALQMTKDNLMVLVNLFNITMDSNYTIIDLSVSKLAYLATAF